MLDVALKEWKIVCDLLLGGELAFLLRKGGIIEDAGPGRFELQHQRFALYPSWAHQKPNMIKPAHRQRVAVMEEPDELTLEGIGEAARIWEVPSRNAFDTLDALHPWTAEQIDMRFNYHPENPLYLVAVRAYRLAQPKTIQAGVVYGGCRSWIPLTPDDAVDDTGATPVMGDEPFEAILEQIDKEMNA